MTDHAEKMADERFCYLCQAHGHQTTECYSTHGLNTPAARELFRLVQDAAAYRAQQEQAQQLADLSDAQCDAFRRLPLSFNDMVRAIYAAGVKDSLTAQAGAAGDAGSVPFPKGYYGIYEEPANGRENLGVYYFYDDVRTYGDQREAAALARIRAAWQQLPTWIRIRQDVDAIRALINTSGG